MTTFFTAKYLPIDTGFMGQIVEWPEVITEACTIEECRKSLLDALHEMCLAYKELGMDTPVAPSLFEQIPVEV